MEDSFFNVIDNSIKLEAGTEVEIRITPIEFHTSKSIKSIAIEQRNCRMPDEVPEEMNLFKKYTKDACFYNCMYEYR